ncbi:MAG: hypothetical protein SGJ24_10345 [Chloroflexota bacterium]|nr:hypothetical protein [Chloroflexota bacterium]
MSAQSDLNSFGAIFAFAIDLESRLRDYYTAAGDPGKAADADKRRTTLERVRRENVTEIKLEPIEGLDSADFAVDLAEPSAEGMAKNAAIAARFYESAAPKLNVREAQRALERAGRAHRG